MSIFYEILHILYLCHVLYRIVMSAFIQWCGSEPFNLKTCTDQFPRLLKGTFQRGFRPPFFHHSNLPRPLSNRLKYFRFQLRFRRVNRIFRTISPGYDIPASQSPRGLIPRGVSFFDTKIQISWRKRNQKRKYFNPLVSDPGWFKL